MKPRHALLALAIVAGRPSLALAADNGGDDPVWRALAEHALQPLDAPQAAAVPAPRIGQPLLLHFWASWCAPCRRELPALDARVERWRQAGLQLRIVSVDREPERARRFAAGLALGMPLCIDGPDGLAKSLDLPALPCSYLFDGEGRRVLEQHGESEDNLKALERALAGLLTPPAPAAAGTGGS